MLGALVTLAFCFTLAAASSRLLNRWMPALDPAARFGLAGMLSLGMLGTLLLPVGLIPGGVRAIPMLAGVLWLIAILALVFQPTGTRTSSFRAARPEKAEILFALALGTWILFAFVGTLSPADALEWDSLAYHQAVPKLWIEAGQIVPVPFIHHSNFPFAIDNLYLIGLQTGGQPAAKAFVLALASLGTIAIFGLARQLYGRLAGWWAALAFALSPVVLWLSGTAYVDVPNGLYAGLGIVLAGLFAKDPANKGSLWLSALCLGLAAGSKYTGLQTIAAVGFALLVVGLYRRQPVRYGVSASLAAGLALLIAAPWYVKNAAWTGNPVYPFFYEKLGGRNWGPNHAAIYKNEQQTFGVGRTESGKDLTQVGHAVFGLAYQPGRYINPGQQTGQGNPMGAIGVAVIACLAAWAISGRAKAFEATCLIAVGISFAMWFLLSQQSRYIVALAVPLAVMLGGGVSRLRAGPILAGLAALQACYSLYLVRELRVTDQLRGLVGLKAGGELRTSFSEMAQRINATVPKTGKVALYDEVFGYFLDVPYFWANPGHSDVIPYASMQDGSQLVDGLVMQGFTHVYISLSSLVRPPNEAIKLLHSFGLAPDSEGFSQAERDAMMASFEQRFLPLLADAAERGRMRVVDARRSGVLFELMPASPGG